MDEEQQEAIAVNNNIVKMFTFLGVVAMLLSATGLFTLVSLSIIKRMKEIEVRKVLGASISGYRAGYQHRIHHYISAGVGFRYGV